MGARRLPSLIWQGGRNRGTVVHEGGYSCTGTRSAVGRASGSPPGLAALGRDVVRRHSRRVGNRDQASSGSVAS
jgi:hypothetical protein